MGRGGEGRKKRTSRRQREESDRSVPIPPKVAGAPHVTVHVHGESSGELVQAGVHICIDIR